MKKYIQKFNLIFTGTFLKYWYFAFAAMLLFMAVDFFTVRNVRSYDLKLFNTDGQIVSERRISADNASMVNDMLPITKSFTPVRWYSR